VLCGPACAPRTAGPLSPEEALKTFEIADGFRLELFASEPYVVDPVEMVFDEDGGIYVAELGDNPYDPPPGEPPLSRIVYLEDTDGDQVIDRRTVFADRLLAVEGVQPWKGGIIATAAPDILFLKDTNGDHKSDVCEVLYTGFALGNVEGRVSNPRLGIDNWIYVANGGRAGEITSPQDPDRAPLQVRGWDFRFHPGRGLTEVASGDAQFGQTSDAWGRWFISQNTVHLRHTVIPARYLARNSFLTVPETAQDISDHGQPAARIFARSQPQQWRIDRTAARQKRYQETRPGQVERLEGYFTASCGATVYVGDAFPQDYVDNVFVSDGNGNLVHRDVIHPDGPTFRASRWPADGEFLTSTDNWFRPVNFANGPDGNLYVLDYYREYLEHPEFIPEAIQNRLKMNFRNGDTLGRIYRIVPQQPRNRSSLKPGLGSNSTAELVELLRHPNGWRRQTAQRLLVERQDESAIPLLRKLGLEEGQPLARLHALWTLEGLSALDASVVKAALASTHPGIREHALLLAEAFLPELSDTVLAKGRDPDERVQFQTALTLGEITSDSRAIQALAGIGAQHAEDPWFRLAVQGTSPDATLALLTGLWRLPDFLATPSEGKQALVAGLSRTVGARRNKAEITRWFQLLKQRETLVSWQRAGIQGLASGLALEGQTGWRLPAVEAFLTALLRDPSEALQRDAREVARFFELEGLIRQASKEALDESLPIERRAMAISSLPGSKLQDVAAVLEQILVSPSAQDLKRATVEALAVFEGREAGQILLRGWRGYDPETRARAAEALLRHRDRVSLLLDALEDGQVEAGSLEPVTRIRLTQFPDPLIQERAARLLELQTDDRAKIVEEYQDLLDIDADAQRGHAVFDRECAKCHLAKAERGRIGPDLSGVNNHSQQALLQAILDPSSAMESRYTNYLVETQKGRLYDGLLSAETSAVVTLRGELEDVTLLRRNIKDIRASRISLMPEGFEKTLNRQELADVIAFLRAGL
jgi:putative membrane-bound dehydrogenase-like protein